MSLQRGRHLASLFAAANPGRVLSVRVLVLSQWFPPEKADIPESIARRLADGGHDVTVLTGFPNYPQGVLFDGWTMFPVMTQKQHGYTIRRVMLYPSHDSSAVHRVLNYLSFAVSSAIFGWGQLRRADVVYVYHPPLSAALGPWLSRRLGGAPYVLHVQDLWPDSIIGSGMVHGKTAILLENLLTLACRGVYRRAARVVAIAPGMAARLHSRGVTPEQLHVIANWADEALFQPRERDGEARQELGLEDTFSVMFAGNLGDLQDLETAIHAAAEVRDLDDFRLVLVGQGVALPRLKKLVADLGVSNVLFHPAQPQARMGALCSAADVQLVSLKDLPFLHGTIPSKLAAIMASGLPVICSAPGDAADLVRQADAGWTAPPGDPYALAAAFRLAHSAGPEALAFKAQRGRQHYLRHSARDVALTTMGDLIAQAVRR